MIDMRVEQAVRRVLSEMRQPGAGPFGRPPFATEPGKRFGPPRRPGPPCGFCPRWDPTPPVGKPYGDQPGGPPGGRKPIWPGHGAWGWNPRGLGPGAQPAAAERPGRALIDVLDVNRDGKIDPQEISRAVELLRKADRNGDGTLDSGDLAAPRPPKPGPPPQPNRGRPRPSSP